jgi:hypothetical protein
MQKTKQHSKKISRDQSIVIKNPQIIKQILFKTIFKKCVAHCNSSPTYTQNLIRNKIKR